MANKPLAKRNGFTLIELVMSMVIISIASVGILSVMNLTQKHSADPLVERQALAIAEAYMEEILLQNYGTCTATSRATYSCVGNYNGLQDVGAHDQAGAAISGLSKYTISVAVAASSLSGGVAAQQVTVSVTGPGVNGLTLVGYRGNY
jgi:MSHA pilin protein MshD